jgi:2-methylaconitate cis-trans-isomerase PrpF
MRGARGARPHRRGHRLGAVDDEDLKLITLARASRARVEAAEGAAVRDETGRTYSAATVTLPSLRLSALQVAVAMAATSGAMSLEAAAVVTEETPDFEVVYDLGKNATVFVAGPDGTLRDTITT